MPNQDPDRLRFLDARLAATGCSPEEIDEAQEHMRRYPAVVGRIAHRIVAEERLEEVKAKIRHARRRARKRKFDSN